MTTVEKIKTKILDFAIRGKLVPQNPDDEPASVLLERIKAEKAKLVKAGKIKKDKNPSEIVVGSDGATYEKFADGKMKDISDEIPFDLPQGWTWARFKQLGSFVGGHTPSLAVASNWENGYVLWVTSKDMKQKYIKDTGFKLSRSGAARLHLLPIGSLLMVTRSGILRRTFPIALAAKQLTINQDQRAIEFHNNEIGEYIYYCIKSLEPIILRDYRKTGTTVESIIWEKFIDILLPIPSISEQKRIVAKIEELFAYIDKIGEASNGIAQAAQHLNKKILDLAIRGQLVPQDPTDEPAYELIRHIEAAKKATEKGRKSSRTAASDRPAYEIESPFDIPYSWEWVRLGDVLLPMETKRPQGETFQYIDIDAIDNTNNVVLTPKRLPVAKAPSRASRGLKSGDTLFSVVRPYLRNIAYIDDSLADCIASTGFYVCRPDEMVAPRFLFWLLLSDYVVNGLNSFMKGDNSPSIRGEQLHDFLVPLPPIAEQKRIVAKIEELRAMTRSLTK